MAAAMEHDNISFMLGRLTSSVDALSTRIEGVESSVKTLNEHMNQTKGGMRVLLLLCSGSAVIGGGFVAFLQWLVARVHI